MNQFFEKKKKKKKKTFIKNVINHLAGEKTPLLIRGHNKKELN